MVVVTSDFAKKADLASLKLHADKLDIDELEKSGNDNLELLLLM